jgi:hypothetical protein
MTDRPPVPSPPHTDSAEYGALRIHALDAALGLRPPDAAVPPPVRAELGRWADEMRAAGRGPARGLSAPQVPERWRETLAWAGMPFGTAGDLHWGTDLKEVPGLMIPELRSGCLLLPVPDTLEQLTSLALKPLRLFVAERLGCRLQSAAGVHVYLWSNQAVLISCSEVPIGGFLHGPEPGQRHSVSMPPGGFQVISW